MFTPFEGLLDSCTPKTLDFLFNIFDMRNNMKKIEVIFCYLEFTKEQFE